MFRITLRIPGSASNAVTYVCSQHFDYYPAQVGRWVVGAQRVRFFATMRTCACCERGL